MSNILFSAITDIGSARKVNQDSVGAVSPLLSDPKRGLFVVCDGMGAHKAGEVASKMVVDIILQKYPGLISKFQPAEALKYIIQVAHKEIVSKGSKNPDKDDMGTTVVAAVVDHNKLHIANVGDSRAYLLRDGNMRQLTIDHSRLNELIQMGALDKNEKKSAQRNVLSRSLSAARSTVKIDMFEEDLLDGDQVLLCSDGLWGQVKERTMKSVLNRFSAEEAGRRLVRLANQAGGVDNVSVLIIQKGVPRKTLFNIWEWLLEHPALISALIGILVALICLLTLTFWLFRV